MSAIAHYEALFLKHNQLKRKLHTAYVNHLSDDVIHSLKKQKYSVKEEMNSLQNQYTIIRTRFGEKEKVA